MKRFSIPCSLHQSLNGFFVNYESLSLISVFVLPNIMRIFFQINIIIFLSVTIDTTSTSIHFVKLPISTIKDLIHPAASKNGPRISIPNWLKFYEAFILVSDVIDM